jgi:hypothetical protein
MDATGARHLAVRLAVGAAVGDRLEVVSVGSQPTPVRAGEAGTLTAIDEESVRVLFDSGAEHALDPLAVELRRVPRSAAA